MAVASTRQYRQGEDSDPRERIIEHANSASTATDQRWQLFFWGCLNKTFVIYNEEYSDEII